MKSSPASNQQDDRTETTDGTTQKQQQPQIIETKNDRLEETPQEDTPYSAFSKYEKGFIVTMAAIGALMSPISAQIYFPAIWIMARHYQVTMAAINLSITAFMIVQGVAPSFMGTFADTGGRRPAYMLCFLIYIAANLGLALQDSYAALMVLRCLQSFGCSAMISLGYGVAADVASPSERGSYMGFMTAGFMSSMSLGPVIGGVLVQWLGWRSIFWFLLIFSGSYLLVYIIAMPETSRKHVGDGNLLPSSRWKRSVIQCVSRPSSRNMPVHHEKGQSHSKSFNPLRSLAIFRNKAASITICTLSLMFASEIAILTSTANIFGGLYGLNTFKIGLCYIPFGVCACTGSILTGFIIDLNYRRIFRNLGHHATDNQEFPFEQARLQVVIPLFFVVVATTLPYGWVLEQNVPLYVPLILQGVLGFCGSACISILSALLVDLFPEQPATASAACNLFRCWLGAVIAAVLDYLFSAMGWGWCFTFFGLVMFAGSPLMWVEYQYGMKWRIESRPVED